MGEDYRVQKGIEGEEFVNEVLNEVNGKLGGKCIIIRNVYIPFPSVYGEDGEMTAESDHIVITPFFLFVIETKNEKYSTYKYEDPIWQLKNGKNVSNPLYQNSTHKLVLASAINIPREKIITIEVLLENGENPSEASPYINDFVLGKEKLADNLCELLSVKDTNYELDFEGLKKMLSGFVKNDRNIKEKHINSLKRTEKIETRIRNVVGRIPFNRTDKVKCPNCDDGYLVFKEAKYNPQNKNTRKSTHYALGCTNYSDAEKRCKGLIYVDAYKYKDSKTNDKEKYCNLKPESIESRNKWGPEVQNKAFDFFRKKHKI